MVRDRNGFKSKLFSPSAPPRRCWRNRLTFWYDSANLPPRNSPSNLYIFFLILFSNKFIIVQNSLENKQTRRILYLSASFGTFWRKSAALFLANQPAFSTPPSNSRLALCSCPRRNVPLLLDSLTRKESACFLSRSLLRRKTQSFFRPHHASLAVGGKKAEHL